MPAISVQLLGDSRSLERAFKRGGDSAGIFASRVTKANEVARGSLSQLGGKTSFLFGSTAFLGAAAATGLITKSIAAASDLHEQITKTDEVFGKSAQTIQAWAKTTATSMGISETAALEATGTFGNLFRAVGILPKQAAGLSESLTKLAADLASFNNTSPEDALAALRSGLVGQVRPLRQYGVLLSQARVAQQAMADTGKTSVKTLTDQEKVLARYEIILKDTSLAQGDFARTSQGFANQTRILKANLQDAADTLGSDFLPAANNVIQDFNALLKLAKPVAEAIAGTGDAAQEAGDKQAAAAKKSRGLFGIPFLKFDTGDPFGIGKFSKDAARQLIVPGAALKNFLTLVGAIPPAVDHADDRLKAASGGLGEFAADARSAGLAASDLAGTVENLASTAKSLDFKSLFAQANGASLQDQIDIQKQIIANDKKIVAASASGSKARKQDLQQQISDQAKLASLQAQVASKAQAAQQKQDQAAQNALDAANKKVQDRISRLDLAVSKAQLSGNLEAQSAALKKELAVVQQLAAKHKDDLELQQKEVDLRGQLLDISKQQADALQQQKDAARQLFGALFQATDEAQQTLTFLGGSRGKKLAPGGGTGQSAQDLLTTIRQQNNSFAQLTKDIATLARRGAPAELLSEARSGQISPAQVDTLAKASKATLDKIFGQVRRADKLIASAAKMELKANLVTVDAKTINLAGSGDRGTRGDIVIQNKVFLDGKQITQSQTRHAKKRANQRRGRVGGTR